MADGADGAVDGTLVDSPVPSHPSRFGGFLAPLLVLLLGEQLVEQEAIFLGKLPDPIEDLFDGCAAHEPSERYSTKGRARARIAVLPARPEKHLTPEAYRARVAELVHQIEATAAAERAKKGVEPLGVDKILEQDPETRPETLDRSPAPCRPCRDAEDPQGALGSLRLVRGSSC